MSTIVARNLPIPLFTNGPMHMMFMEHFSSGLTLDVTHGSVGEEPVRPVVRAQVDYRGKPMFDCIIYDTSARGNIYVSFMKKTNEFINQIDFNIKESIKNELMELVIVFVWNHAEVSKTELMLAMMSGAFDRGESIGKQEFKRMVRESLKPESF